MTARSGMWPTAHTRVAAVIGAPVRHSLSPTIHNAAFESLGLDWLYVAFEVAPGEGAAAVDATRTLGLSGVSVTMPHKADVVRALDELTPVAAALGAVNTIVPSAGGLLGDNTDGAGFIDALMEDEGFDPHGARCVVLGAGGAARAVLLALADQGAREIVIVNRTLQRAEEAATLAPRIARPGPADAVDGADLLVNCTPIGMGDGGDLPVDASRLATGQLIVDLVYHPPVTPLLAAARARGATAVNGLGTLIHQAGRQFRQWTGVEPPLEVMSAAAAASLAASATERAETTR